jgi:hypothetical protein
LVLLTLTDRLNVRVGEPLREGLPLLLPETVSLHDMDKDRVDVVVAERLSEEVSDALHEIVGLELSDEDAENEMLGLEVIVRLCDEDHEREVVSLAEYVCESVGLLEVLKDIVMLGVPVVDAVELLV